MGESPENKPNRYKKHICIGILAHVDAGKTTLSEAILYLTGSIRRLGRVDHKDTFFDTFALERARGITIFSKQARLVQGNTEITLLDTPGHVDFSAEMERTLQVLDYGILVISGADGVQGHTHTLWKLLERYHIPTFLFINKMDQEGADREALLSELREQLDEGCVDFGEDQEAEVFQENLAMCDEALLDEYVQNGRLELRRIRELIRDRRIFPCFFGSALKLNGVEALLEGLERYTLPHVYGKDFAARVYKISRDDQGNRLTHLKVTGGSLKVKMPVESGDRRQSETAKPGSGAKRTDEETREEKIGQIRLYSGEKYETVNEVAAGTVCAVTGLSHTFPGQGLGAEQVSQLPVLEPVLTYRILLPEGCDLRTALSGLRQLEEEEPELHLVWNEQLRELHAQLMGEVQVEVLKSLVRERYGMDIEFGEGNIVYKETILQPAEGVGHYEPLRHYAEVHLLLEPGEPGSGLQFGSVCSEEILGKSWQRLVLTHLEEKEHLGVLTGSPITDMRITLLTGRAHLKHTEGGDFRQATYRAVRQGLKEAKSILLEPYYQYRLEVPQTQVGKAMTDIQGMFGEFSAPEVMGDMAVLTGSAPVSEMRNYQAQVAAYTGGRGRLSCRVEGYRPCHNEEEVIQARGYDSEADTDNPSGSIFCAHGAGFWVDWTQVKNYMHIDSGWRAERKASQGNLPERRTGQRDLPEQRTSQEDLPEQKAGQEHLPEQKAGQEHLPAAETESLRLREAEMEKPDDSERSGSRIFRGSSWGSSEEEKELEAIFARTYGPVKRERFYASPAEVREYSAPAKKGAPDQEPKTEYLLVDGYNIIFSWDELRELAEDNIDGARNRLMDILSNYQGMKKCVLILVFDAYRVSGGTEQVTDYHNIHVVYTREAETADQYIERTTHRIARRHQVTVATSDGMEQIIILGQGAARMSARELKEDVERVCEDIRREFLDRPAEGRNYLFHHLDGETREMMEDVRLGKRILEK